jgi:hypothetical protein
VLVARCEDSMVTRRISAPTFASFPGTDQPALETACKRDDCRDYVAHSGPLNRDAACRAQGQVEIMSHQFVVSKGWERQEDNSLRSTSTTMR